MTQLFDAIDREYKAKADAIQFRADAMQWAAIAYLSGDRSKVLLDFLAQWRIEFGESANVRDILDHREKYEWLWQAMLDEAPTLKAWVEETGK